LRAVLMGCACACGIGGGYYALGGGHDAVQIVHKDPATVYQAFDNAFSEMVDEGNNGVAVERGQTSTITKVPGKALDIKIEIQGQQAVRLRFGFEPARGGDTKTTADIDVDEAVLRESIKRQHGGNDVAIPPLPQFALDLAMQKLLTEAALKIEKGEPLETPHSTYAMASGSSYPSSNYGQPDWSKKYREEEAMRKASAPMMDPDAAARNYMGSHAYDR